ncbi:tyrosine-type recombinase/integrase [Saccharothrix sp. HUAS TT1]|uniref:tyrosine-type recombinase/integrase n=1 Tax=unclassified Saccharothrix TaxID=2593673 RepID=UPI00345C30FD
MTLDVESPHPDEARFEPLVGEWLLGYRSEATRMSYADALGLPRDWVRRLTGTAATPVTPGTRPPVREGKYRDLAWLRWCAAHGLHPLRVTGLEVKRWLAELVAAGMPKSTRGHRLAVLAQFYRFLLERGAVTANPAAFDRRGLGLGTGGDTSSTVVITPEQVDALLVAAHSVRRGANPVMRLRATAVVALFTLGVRVSELTGARREDLHVTRGRRALRITGKGDKTRIVYLSGLAADALDAYLAERDRQAGTALPAARGHVAAGSAPLIATGSGGPVNPRDVWALIRRLAVAAGPELAEVADRIRPHALRHFYVTAAAEAGADMTHVQADVGHASVDTTNRVYNRAARHPDRSAVDLVEQSLLRARADRAARQAPARAELRELLAGLPAADPLDQLVAIGHLERLVGRHPELAPAVAGALADLDGHPKVAAEARAARARLS